MPDLTKLLPKSELDRISKLAYMGGPGDPQRDVRMLLMHIDALESKYEIQYQCALVSYKLDWIDCSKDRFDECNRSILYKTRIRYKSLVPPEDCKP